MPTETFIQNSITKDFVNKANELIKKRLYDYKGLSKALDWNKTAMSATINGTRNVPMDKWERFEKIYKEANKEPEKQVNELQLLKASNEVIARYVLDLMASYYSRPLRDPAQKNGVQDQFERDIQTQLEILGEVQKS